MPVRRPAEGARLLPEPRATWWWLGVVVLVGVLVRRAFLAEPMRQDEADTVVLYALTPLRHILVDTVLPNNHILHSILVRASMLMFGDDPWIVRTPAFIAGVAVTPLAFFTGRAFYSSPAGLWGAALVAISTPLVLYSVNARGYSLIVAATLLCLLFLAEALQANRWSSWLGFSLAAAAGAFVNPSMLYPVGGMVLWAVAVILPVKAGRKARLTRLVAACAAAGAMAMVSYVPALMVSGWRSVVGNSYVRPLAWSRFLGTLPGFATDLGAYVSTGWPAWLLAVVGIGLLTGLAFHARLARHRWSAALCMLAWAVLLMLVMRRAPFVRVWLFLIPVFAIVAGAGLARLASRVRALSRPALAGLLPACLAIGLGWQLVTTGAPRLLTETGVFPDGKAVADRLAVELSPGDMVAARWLSQGPVDYYLRRSGKTAPFVSMNDSVAGRLFIVQADELEDTPGVVVAWRKLRGLDTTRVRRVARYPKGALWLIEPPPAGR